MPHLLHFSAVHGQDDMYTNSGKAVIKMLVNEHIWGK